MTHHVSRTTRHGSRPSERGVALVVTLLLLSVITFMVVTFLVVSRSQKGSVTTETDQAIARLAADMALERAKAAIIAPMLAWTNQFSYGLLVSANYINRHGFDQTLPVPGPVNPTNVNYDYTRAGLPLTFGNQRNQNIANLLYDPRPPVFITTNRLQPPEFRYYLDWNRNGRYDTNGLLPVISGDPVNPFFNIDGTPMPFPTDGVTLSNFFVGDPEWIGSLERPEFAHSADNRFVNRYAYIAVPVGQTLDLNNIHNDAKRRDMSTSGDGFLRNQGVLTAEINLAAFLADLNTNLWPTAQANQYGSFYDYYTDPSRANDGAAFDDAFALLRFRYDYTLASLANVRNLFGLPGVSAFSPDLMDYYSGGPVMTNTSWPPPNYPLLPVNQPRVNGNWPWAGGDNPNHFYTTQELFDTNKTHTPWLLPGRLSITERLLIAGAATNSYDRYTYYRLLSQLGTDSAPEAPGKLNLNYCNVDNYGNVVPDMATNFIPWTPVQFFTNAANRLLADAGYNFTTAGIQLWPTNYYTPSVHRLLQLAANMYDASTTRSNTAYPYLPSVFRPLFLSANGGSQVFISGYAEETGTALLSGRVPWRDLQLAADRAALQSGDMAYGVPVVIGAKKGFPSFNELAMQTQVQVTRKLQFLRPAGSTTMPVSQTNQMFVVTISNVFGVEAWNSYGTNFPRSLRMTVLPDVSIIVTNEAGTVLINRRYQPPVTVTNILAGVWPGYDPAQEQYSFQVPVLTNLLFLTNSTYSRSADRFVTLTGRFEPISPAFYVPHWWLNLRTRLRLALIDTSGPLRIVDFVNLDSAETPLNLTDTLMQGGTCGDEPNPFWTPNPSDGSMWCTNHYPRRADETVPTYGIMNQIEASVGNTSPDWNHALHEFPPGLTREGAIDFFRAQFDLPPLAYFNTTFYKSNAFNAPFQPTRNLYLFTTWQANDPLVHYTIGDLLDLGRTNRVEFTVNNSTVANLGWVNKRYEPWGGNPAGGSSSPTKTALQVKDPLVRRSDDWDFPTNRFPNVGWLGRVHRGTPWQTLYLKSPGIDLPAWQKWSGNAQVVTNGGQIATNWVALNYVAYDAFFSQPTNDWRLLDRFTTALNGNATRGQLSINQTNLAAWSAVLSGVVVLTNDVVNGTTTLLPRVIQPAGVYNPFDSTTWPPTVRLVKAINDRRATNFTGQVFRHLGDILAVPEFTVASPFLNTNIPPTDVLNYVVNDAAYERLPQQILGLLKCDDTPRFVVYSFGQTLKPAEASIVSSSQFFGLCTNYQIMAEAATRAVVRVEGAPNHPRAVVESFNLLPPD